MVMVRLVYDIRKSRVIVSSGALEHCGVASLDVPLYM